MKSTMFLSIDELREMTRRSNRGTMIDYLRRQGIPHLIADDGYPIVLRDVIEKLLGEPGEFLVRKGPDFDALREMTQAYENKKFEWAKKRVERAREKALAKERREQEWAKKRAARAAEKYQAAERRELARANGLKVKLDNAGMAGAAITSGTRETP